MVPPPPNGSLPPKGSGALFFANLLAAGLGLKRPSLGAGGRGGGGFFCFGGRAGVGEVPFLPGLKGSAPNGSVPND